MLRTSSTSVVATAVVVLTLSPSYLSPALVCAFNFSHQQQRQPPSIASSTSSERVVRQRTTIPRHIEPPSQTSQSETVPIDDTYSPSVCPFSMSFPRYRIDLSSASSVAKRFKSAAGGGGSSSSSSNTFGIFSRLKDSLDRSAIERQYSREAKDGRLLLADCTVQEEDLLMAKGAPLAKAATEGPGWWMKGGGVGGGKSKFQGGGVSDDQLRQGMEGLRAAAQFWRALANVAVAAEEGVGTQPRRTVLSFTGASFLQVQRLVDIASWLEDSLLDESSPIPAGPIVHVELDDEAPNPSILIERHTSAILHFVENEDERNKLKNDMPTAGIVEERIKAWVTRVLVELSICPFTKSAKRSGQGLGDLGIPTGNISYHYSQAGPANIYQLMADTWSAIVDMIDAGPGGKHGVSSILLAAPKFDESFPLWAGPVFAMLETGVGASDAEPIIGVVCFHPQYATPDGSSFPGFGHMHSTPRLRKWIDEVDPILSESLSDVDVAAGGAWQRRTPHSVINVLRADQLEAAESLRDSPQMYTRNISVLVGKDCGGIGSKKLQNDLIHEQSIK